MNAILSLLSEYPDAAAIFGAACGMVGYYWLCGLLRQAGYRLRRPVVAPWQVALTKRSE